MNDYAYNKIYEEVANDWENYGFDSQDEAIEWLTEHLIG